MYVATERETDDAIRKRFERHRRDSDAIWRTTTMPADILDLVAPGALEGCGAAVFDGISVWIAAQLRVGTPSASQEGEADRAVLESIEALSEKMYRSTVPIVATSMEMGFGVLPSDPAERRHLNVITSANQIMARRASAMVLMASGLPIKVR
jgi:adenosyl cobinamide kinase/adenosyl cobinamide phosphate guanylyltransferase